MAEFNPFESGATTVAEPPAEAGGFDPFAQGGARPAPAAMFTPRLSVTRADPDAAWRNVYAGLEGLDKRLDPAQLRAFTALDHVAKDPAEERARAINQTFIGEKLKMAPAAISSNWGAVKSAFAKDQLGIDQAEIPDKALYGWLGGRLDPKIDFNAESGEFKPWTWHDTLKADYYATNRNLGKFWDAINSSPAIEAIPDPPANLPDLPMGIAPISPAVAAGVWTGAVKPLLAAFTSPFGAATLGLGSELSVATKLEGAEGALAKKALGGMSGVFTAWMGYGFINSVPETLKVLNDPRSTTQEKVTAMSSSVSTGIMATLAAVGTALSFAKEKAPKVADSLAGKKPSEAAEIFRQEAMVSINPDAADAFNRAATHFEELAAYERGPNAWETAAHPQERIVAAAIRTEDGAVAEGPAHKAIRQELAALDKVPLAEGESVNLVEGKAVVTLAPAGEQEGFVTPIEKPTVKIEHKTIADLSTAWEARGIKNDIHENGDVITLSRVVVPEETRGGGLGTAAMKELIAYADANQKTVVTTPSTDFGGSSLARLKRFYKRFGFIENKGKSKDFRTRETMIRTPREIVQESETPTGAQEGFVTSSGRFVDRVEARAIAEGAGQVVAPEVPVDAPPTEPPPVELQSHEVDMGPPRSSFNQTALKNAYGDLERVAYGFDAAPPTEKHAMAELWERAGEVLKKDPKAGERLAAELKGNANLGLSDEQSALLLRHKVDLERALNGAADAAADPNAAPQVKAEAQKQVRELSDQLLDILNANYARGTEWGREGRWRQALAREDYSFASQETLLRASKGDAQLTDAERAGLQKRIDDLQAKQAELDAHIARITSESHTAAADRAVRAMSSPRAARPLRVAETIRVKLHARAEESMKYLFSGKQFTIGPDVLYHMSVIGADAIYSTGLDLAQWSTAMVTKLGEKVKPHLAEVWEASRKLFHAENRAGLIADLSALPPAERPRALSRVAQELARAQIEQGVKEREAIVDAVHADVAKGIPDISKREVMDAISGYGQFKPLTHDQIAVELADVKGQLQQVAKLEDLEAGKKLKKTGGARYPASAEEQALRKQVAGAQKMEQVIPAPPDPLVGKVEKTPIEKFTLPEADDFGKLKEEVDAEITEQLKDRLEKQIADLERQIETRTKDVRESKGTVHDDEVARLKARRDELREQFDGVFGRAELTNEQRVNIFKAYANRRIGELQERLATKDFDPRVKRPPPRLDEEGNRLKGELERIKQDFAIARAEAEEAAQPGWQRKMQKTADLARASALSGYHTLYKLAAFSLGRFAETPVTEAVGAMVRQIPGLRRIGKLANLEAGAEYRGLGRYYSQAATQGMIDAWETLKTGKSNLKAELADRRFNERPVRWYDYFGLSHMVEKSPLLRGEFELRLEKNFQAAVANGLDVTDPLVNGAIRKEAFDYSQRAILQEDNMFSDWINSLTQRLEAANPKVGKPDVIKMALSTFVKTFLTKGIVKTPANYVMQTLERTPLGLAKGTMQAVVAHMQGVDKLTPQEANVIYRLLKVGSVGTAMFVWGAIDATKDPKDRIFGGYYQGGEKRGDQDVGFGKIRVAGHEFPHLVTHNPLTESAQMGTTFVRVMKSRLSKKDAKDKGALAGGMAAILGLASEAPIVNPITQMAEKVARGNADEVFWDEIAGLVPMLAQNIASDLDAGKSRKPESFKQRMELTVPGLRGNVPETKAQKKRDIRERLKK